MSGISNSIFEQTGSKALTPAQEALAAAIPERKPSLAAQINSQSPQQDKTTLAPAQSKVIPPSIGRVLWFWPSSEYKEAPGAQAQTCQVCYVHSDRMVNIAGFNCNGEPFALTSVQLRQPEDPDPLGSFVEWMPYQIGQVK